MTPQQLLDAAGELLAGPPPSMRRCWQRACASLTRAALEQSLGRYWESVEPSMVNRPMRHQLLALPILAKDDETAAIARAAWHGLSRAVHHHTYELPPTVAELHGWHSDVTVLLSRLATLHDGP